MSMAMHTLPSVHVMSWVEMKPNVAMRYEVDRRSETVPLFFGSGDEYVLDIHQDNLDQLLDLCAAAKRELANPPVGHQ